MWSRRAAARLRADAPRREPPQVWKAEQKREKEDKKLKELQKQIDEERQIEELRTMQKDAGLVTDPKQKLEWMYRSCVEMDVFDTNSSARVGRQPRAFSSSNFGQHRPRYGRDGRESLSGFEPTQ